VLEDFCSLIAHSKIFLKQNKILIFLGFQYCKILNLSNNPKMNDFSLQNMATKCENAVVINLSNCPNIRDSNLMSILKACKKLKRLIINNSLGITEK
jgi:hypothetical protein